MSNSTSASGDAWRIEKVNSLSSRSVKYFLLNALVSPSRSADSYICFWKISSRLSW